VKIRGENPEEVWTGSTNFTDSGFLGQTNVGHIVVGGDTPATYLQYWDNLKENPVTSIAREQAIELTPNPRNVLPKNSVSDRIEG
jgi:hypothetical protein